MSAPGASTAPSGQTLRGVALAELRRTMRRGGMRVGVLLGVVVAALSGVGTTALVGSFATDSERTTLLVTLPIEVAATVAGLWLSLTSVLYFARDASNGMLRTSLLLVPNRSRLFGARALAATAVGLGGALTALSVVAAVALAAHAEIPGAVRSAVTGLSAGTLAVVTFVVFGHFFAAIARRPTAAALMFVGVVIVCPLVFAVGQSVLPATVVPALEGMSRALPSPLLMRAASVSTVPALGPGPLALGLAGLAAWCVIAGAAASVMFRRYDS